jgi:hypothetical protein
MAINFPTSPALNDQYTYGNRTWEWNGTAWQAVVISNAHEVAADPHTQYQKESEKGVADGYASLDSGGQVPAAQIPAIAITEYLGAAANQAAMLALVGQKGDWCTRTDLGTNWVITGNDPTQLASWTALTYPASPVTSVNSETGAVVLDATDVGAAPVSHGTHLTDGDKGDITVGSSGTTLTIDASAVTGTKIANDAVDNTKLANMAQSTIKGRAVSAGTGDPTDLTATEATAILNSFVGDSGAGGTKGLVPAPAAGDAAAGKVLKADGTWAAAAGGGTTWHLSAVAENTLPSNSIGVDGDYVLVDYSAVSGVTARLLFGPKASGAWSWTRVQVLPPFNKNGRGISTRYNGFSNPVQGKAVAQLPVFVVQCDQWSASSDPATAYPVPWDVNVNVVSASGSSTTSGTGFKATTTGYAYVQATTSKASIFGSAAPISTTARVNITTLPTEVGGYCGPILGGLAQTYGGDAFACLTASVDKDGVLRLQGFNGSGWTTWATSDSGQVVAGDKVLIERRGDLLEATVYESTDGQKMINVSGTARPSLRCVLRGQMENVFFASYGVGIGLFFRDTTAARLNMFYGVT